MCPCPICYPNNGSCSDNCWEKYGGQFVSCPLHSNKEIVEQPVYLPDLSGRLLARAINFVKEAQNSGNSFFLFYSFHHIHHPQFASSLSVNKSPRGPVGDALLELDLAIRTMMDLLKELNILDDTFIWFTSDNGPSLKHHELGGCAGPLRCGKGTTWEGGVRVPSIVYWRDKIAPGRSNELTSSLDILPTVASIAGLTTDHLTLDGIDLSSSLLKEQVQSKREFFAIYPEFPSMETGPFAIVYNQYKAHFYTKGSILSDDRNNDKLCTPMHTLTKHDPPLLFDLYADPGEKYDLSGKNEYKYLIPIISDWRDEHMRNMTWMPPRTVQKLDRSQPCCTHRHCTPFPQCCDCSAN